MELSELFTSQTSLTLGSNFPQQDIVSHFKPSGHPALNCSVGSSMCFQNNFSQGQKIRLITVVPFLCGISRHAYFQREHTAKLEMENLFKTQRLWIERHSNLVSPQSKMTSISLRYNTHQYPKALKVSSQTLPLLLARYSE